MPTCTQPLPDLQPNVAIFPFILVPFVSQLAIATMIENAADQSNLDENNVGTRNDDISNFDTSNIDENYPQANVEVSFQCAQTHIKTTKNRTFATYQWVSVEALQVQWLIGWFAHWFAHRHTLLVKGTHEPEYFAATATAPAKIVFAHGFFASSLHEISHWCVAGKQRRALNDFGYWYAPDGRNQYQQQQFEQVEIKPQAIECLLTLACNKPFNVSKDNLFADFDTSHSTFEMDVAAQAVKYWQTGDKLSTDAKVLLHQLLKLRPLPLTTFDITHNFIAVN